MVVSWVARWVDVMDAKREAWTDSLRADRWGRRKAASTGVTMDVVMALV